MSMIIVRLHVLASILLGAHFHRTHSFAPPSLPTRRIIALPQTQHQQFQGPLEDHSTIDTRGTTMTALFSSTNKGNKNVGADFDYQELKINLRAMKKQQLTTANQLEEGKRKELEGYVRNVVKQRPSPIPLWEIGGNDAKGGMLSGTKWRLSFSTQAVTNESLPPGVQIQLDFVDERRVDYSMEFTKTFGLSKLTAESSYQVDSSPVNPGWVTYTYEKITTDVLGFKNVGIGMLGLLQGRGAQIQTVYFDDELWIETGKDGAFDYFNVYTREDDDDDWQQP